MGFQYIGGLAPCVLCLWQRWPHLLALLVGLLSLKVNRAWVYLAGSASAATSAGIGIFHAGVEQGYWSGLKSCAGNLDVTALSTQDALEAILTSNIAKCDAVAWEMAGLSMASWNAFASLCLALGWLWAAKLLWKASQAELRGSID